MWRYSAEGGVGEYKEGSESFPLYSDYFWNSLFQFLYSLSFQGPLW